MHDRLRYRACEVNQALQVVTGRPVERRQDTNQPSQLNGVAFRRPCQAGVKQGSALGANREPNPMRPVRGLNGHRRLLALTGLVPLQALDARLLEQVGTRRCTRCRPPRQVDATPGARPREHICELPLPRRAVADSRRIPVAPDHDPFFTHLPVACSQPRCQARRISERTTAFRSSSWASRDGGLGA